MAGRRPGATALLALASVAATLAAAEVLVRFAFPAPQRVTVVPAADLDDRRELEQRPAVFRVRDSPEQALQYFFRNTLAGRRMRGNTVAVIEHHRVSGRSVEVRTNRLGYRGPEVGPKSGLRFLFLGDSITLAAYLPDEETFVRRVESRARAEGLSWETVNTGVDGISLKTELAILLESGLSVEPDVVVLDFYLNDFQESLGVYLHEPAGLLRYSRLLQHVLGPLVGTLPDMEGATRADPAAKVYDGEAIRLSQPEVYMQLLRDSQARIDGWRQELESTLDDGDPDGEKRAFYKEVFAHFEDWGGAFSPRAWEYMHPLFERLATECRGAGVGLVVVCFPVAPQVTASDIDDVPQRHLRAICRQLDLPFLDLLPAFRAAHADGVELFHDVCHHTPRGSDVVAEQLFAFLRAHT